MRLRPSFTLLLLTLATTVLCSCGSDDDNVEWPSSLTNNRNSNRGEGNPVLQRLEFPKVKKGSSFILIHSTNDRWGINYCVEWDWVKKAQRWSAYQINHANLAKNTSRAEIGYPMDPELPTAYYLSQDCFYNSGFDHGHICPSADRLYSNQANEQTFYLTNMQPQYKAFNGSLSGSESEKNGWSPWYRLENLVRTWGAASSTDTLYVVKGGTIEDDQVLRNNDGTMRLIKGEMRIPKYFFVALLLKNVQGYKGVGFWMEHQSRYLKQELLSNYVVNIRDLEEKTGIDFFCNLPDDIENSVETQDVATILRIWNLVNR